MKPLRNRPSHSSRLPAFMPPLITLVLVAAAWDLAVRFGAVEPFILPPPADVARALVDDADVLFSAALNTAIAAAGGFAMSGVAGVLLAIALASAAPVRRAVSPYLVFFQTVPIVAIAPLIVIWAGYGMPTALWSACIVSLFPVVANTLAGIDSTDPALRDLFRLYGARPLATLWKLTLPSALPQLFTGLRVSGGLAVIGAIVGEFIGGQGSLGDTIQVALQQQKIAQVYAAVLLGSLLGLALLGIVAAAEKVSMRRWKN